MQVRWWMRVSTRSSVIILILADVIERIASENVIDNLMDLRLVTGHL